MPLDRAFRKMRSFRPSSPATRRSGCTCGTAPSANSVASSPPVPARISRTTFFASFGSSASSISFSSPLRAPSRAPSRGARPPRRPWRASPRRRRTRAAPARRLEVRNRLAVVRGNWPRSDELGVGAAQRAIALHVRGDVGFGERAGKLVGAARARTASSLEIRLERPRATGRGAQPVAPV